MGLAASSVKNGCSWFLHLLIRVTANFKQSQHVQAAVPGPHDLQTKRLPRKAAELEQGAKAGLRPGEGGHKVVQGITTHNTVRVFLFLTLTRGSVAHFTSLTRGDKTNNIHKTMLHCLS